MIAISDLKSKIPGIMLSTAAGFSQVFAQASPAKGLPPADDGMGMGMYLGLFVVVIVGVGALVMVRKREAAAASGVPVKKTAGVADKKGLKPGEFRMTFSEKSKPVKMTPLRKREVVQEEEAPAKEPVPAAEPALPIYSFVRLERTPPFNELTESDDEDLLCAIEQTQEDSDEDAEIRQLSLKIIGAFKTSNSVEALSQMALYDLSAKLRSNAVSMLAALDHESVFETVVTACADPTREVRAAAARGLFNLSFDRAHAWARIVESQDISRMRQAARAATEGDLVGRSIERLVHTDKNAAYEAFALTALLIKAGETEPIYKTLAEHKNEALKLALLHVLQTIKNETTFDDLSELITHHNLTPNVAAKVNEVRSYSQLMGAL